MLVDWLRVVVCAVWIRQLYPRNLLSPTDYNSGNVSQERDTKHSSLILTKMLPLVLRWYRYSTRKVSDHGCCCCCCCSTTAVTARFSWPQNSACIMITSISFSIQKLFKKMMKRLLYGSLYCGDKVQLPHDPHLTRRELNHHHEKFTADFSLVVRLNQDWGRTYRNQIMTANLAVLFYGLRRRLLYSGP